MSLFNPPVFPFLPGASASVSSAAMPLPLLAEISGGHLVAISAILGGLAFTILLILFGLKFVQRRQELWHETARVALEKGQPLPPLPRDMREEEQAEDSNDIRSGLILIATGAGLYLFFVSLFGGWMKYIGAIPGFIGVALLLYGLFAHRGPRHPPKP